MTCIVPVSIESKKLSSIEVATDDVVRATRIIHAISSNFATSKHASSLIGGTEILIPIDLSPKSLAACRVGFDLAERLNVGARLLHSYLIPQKELNIVDVISQDDTLMSAENVRQTAQTQLSNFGKMLKQQQILGEMPQVSFTTDLVPGMPEECILEKAKLRRPKLIVMSTRSRHRKAEELIGSVTAEVLDGSRVPLFTVPEDYECPGIRNITRLVFFCHGDNYDKTSMERFLALFDFPALHITLLPVMDRDSRKASAYVDKLAKEFGAIYPESQFDTLVLNKNTFRNKFKDYLEDEEIELLVVQNKKKNIFSRLLNPGIAHILLYERDMPMIILPV